MTTVLCENGVRKKSVRVEPYTNFPDRAIILGQDGRESQLCDSDRVEKSSGSSPANQFLQRATNTEGYATLAASKNQTSSATFLV